MKNLIFLGMLLTFSFSAFAQEANQMTINRKDGFWPADCDQESGLKVYGKMPSYVGVDAVRSEIETHEVQDRGTVIITGKVYGESCKLSSVDNKYHWVMSSLKANPYVDVTIYTRLSTYSKIEFLDDYSFIMVSNNAVSKFYSSSDAAKILAGEPIENAKFTVSFRIREQRSNYSTQVIRSPFEEYFYSLKNTDPKISIMIPN